MDPLYPVYARNPMTGQRHINFVPSWIGRVLGAASFAYLDFTIPTVCREHRSAELVNRIANRLLPRVWSDPATVQARRNIRVIQDDKTMNAFSAPGTLNIGIFTGIIKEIDAARDEDFPADLRAIPREDKVAGVLAHEIAHSQGDHFGRKLSLECLLVLPLIFMMQWAEGLRFAVCDTAYTILEYGKTRHESLRPAITAAQLALSYSGSLLKSLLTVTIRYLRNRVISQNLEYEADKYGMHLLQRAGYNPRALLWLTHFFADKQGLTANATLSPYWELQQALSSHPIGPDRIAAAENTLRTLPVPV